MPSNAAASVFGGAGLSGSRASAAASPEGLRGALRNDAWAAAPPPADELRGLNGRLSGYLGRVKRLERDNGALEREIEGILAERRAREGRDWDAVEKPLEDLKEKIKDLAMENAKLLLQIDNARLAKEDFKNKLEDEARARKELAKDVEDLKRTEEVTGLSRERTRREIDSAREELARLRREHEAEVATLSEKIKDSEVKVEVVDPRSADLAEALGRVRGRYDKAAEKSLRETEEWYRTKFQNIKAAEEARNDEVLLSGKAELREMLKQKRSLEIKVQGLHGMIRSLEKTLAGAEAEHGRRLAPVNQAILGLEAALGEARSQAERQAETNRELLCVKMRLETEIGGYRRLMQGVEGEEAEDESVAFSSEDALGRERQRP